MSNTVTFTFDDTIQSIGDTITLNQISSSGQIEVLIFTYQAVADYSNFILIPTPNSGSIGEVSAGIFSICAGSSLNSSLYEVYYNATNVVTITALTEDFAIESGSSTFNGVTIDVYFTPLDPLKLNRIHARSPYFVSANVFDGTEVVEVTSAKFDIYIYEGVLDVNKPSTPTYTYEKKPRYANDTNIYIDISRQISDFIDNKYNDVLQTDSVFVVRIG